MLQHDPHRFGETHVDIRWAAMMTSLSVGHLRRLCRQGRIEGARKRWGGSGHWMIPVASLDRSIVASVHWYLSQEATGRDIRTA